MEGTAISGIGRVCDVISETGSETSGSGHWTWLKPGTAEHMTQIISAYLPQKPGFHAHAWMEPSHYFEAREDMTYPSTISIEDLLCLLLS